MNPLIITFVHAVFTGLVVVLLIVTKVVIDKEKTKVRFLQSALMKLARYTGLEASKDWEGEIYLTQSDRLVDGMKEITDLRTRVTLLAKHLNVNFKRVREPEKDELVVEKVK